MSRATLQSLLTRVTAPTGGGTAVGDFRTAARQMSTLFALITVLHGSLRVLTGAVTNADYALMGAAAVLGIVAWAPRRLARAWVAHVVTIGWIVALGGAMYGHVADVQGQSTGALMLLIAWPLILTAYYCRLPVALGYVAFTMATIAVELVAVDYAFVAPQRLTAILVVFGTLTPMIAMVRIRAELSLKYLHEAALRDPLTGLSNRRGFEQSLHIATTAARSATGHSLSVLVTDVDYFKAVNDQFGHAKGDGVLTDVSNILFLEAPPGAMVARIGGEEFGIILEGMRSDEALELAERLRRSVEAAFSTTSTHVTLSVGVVGTDAYDDDADVLMRYADHALYAAKALGRNRAIRYSDDVLDVLERARVRQEEASRTQLATLLTLGEALDLRDPSTALHSRTVADYAEGMARELGLEPALVERIRLAGLLHDIGKIGVPDSVLLHPGKLDAEQWAIMKQHPEIGARMLNHVDYVDIRDWVIAHHERPDGCGYPYQLHGTEIPLGARILSVADSYEAMTADRVYRAAPGHAYALAELRRGSGTQFDPAVVAAMERYLMSHHIGQVPPEESLAAADENDGDGGYIEAAAA
ncbi:MAG: diguanylate cyclase [Thermoleophilia bacterium]|nr:diguanylate cyclase [Thermoleophilia bacterium]